MDSEPELPSSMRLLPWFILVAMLGITWLLWNHEQQNVRKELRSQFDFALRDTVSRIEQRESAYEQMLRGVQGLFATTDLMDRDAVRDYIETLQLDANFSGIQGVGVIKRVPQAHLDTHISLMRRLGVNGYEISPPGVRDVYAPIIQRAPEPSLDQSILGVDPWANPVRRAAMGKAQDSGMPAITGKLRLSVDKSTDAPPGFVMYLPLYAHGFPIETIAQRRANLIGWVYASFHMSDFMASLYGKQASGLALAIYDGVDLSDSALMYQAGNAAGQYYPAEWSALHANEYMVVAGHTWTLSLSTQDEFEARFGRNMPLIIAVAGIALSFSISLLVWFMVNARARALKVAARMTEELRHMAQHDPLTGLPNRALFSDRVKQSLAHAKRHKSFVAMIFIDLDNFKYINDHYGHAIGDQLLQQVALRLLSVIRASDTAGRIGGDEFVVLMDDLPDTTAALGLAEKIRHAVAQNFKLKPHDLEISCSIGVAVYPKDGADEETLTRSADQAMYRAKDSGRNAVLLASS